MSHLKVISPRLFMYTPLIMAIIGMPQLSFAQGGNDALYIDPSGNVGIGTSTPQARLTVQGGTIVNGSTILNGNTNLNGDVLVGKNSNTTVKLEVNGRMKDQTGYVMPVGGIIMYAPKGDINALFDANGVGRQNTDVEGWAICNGENGRPDLRGRFVVGAGKEVSKGSVPYKLPTEYKITDTGGKAMHVITVQQMPRHNHKLEGVVFRDAVTSAAFDKTQGGYWRNEGSTKIDDQKLEKVGDNEAFDNRPPYYALLYIIKL